MSQSPGIRRLSIRRCVALSLLALSASSAVAGSTVGVQSAAVAADGDPVLKLDTPKLDKLPEKKTLKGGVSHHEAAASKTVRLQSNTATASIKAQDSKLKTGSAKTGGFLNMFKSRAKLDKERAPINLNAQAQSGVGIIGVKFLIGFNLPPTINRVFPGTPAFNAGIRVNDIIVAVDGVPTSGLTKEEVYAMIVGLPETPVTISILRNGDFLPKTMKRMDFNDIPDPGVKADYLMSI